MINVRKKGHAFERRVAQNLRDIYPDVKRHLEMQKSDCVGIDLDHTGIFQIQCKKGKQVPKKIYDYYKQIKTKGIKTVIMARDNEEILVTISLTDFKKLIK